jgi:DNA-binding response OmpR family regulator
MTQKVLLIEDDMTMLALLRTLLQFEGFTVAHLQNDADLESALDAIRLEKPDVILLDVHLRAINGFDLLRAIRQTADMANTRVIMSSGLDFSERCQSAGANEFILKPYLPDDLITKIRKVIENPSSTMPGSAIPASE